MSSGLGYLLGLVFDTVAKFLLSMPDLEKFSLSAFLFLKKIFSYCNLNFSAASRISFSFLSLAFFF